MDAGGGDVGDAAIVGILVVLAVVISRGCGRVEDRGDDAAPLWATRGAQVSYGAKGCFRAWGGQCVKRMARHVHGAMPLTSERGRPRGGSCKDRVGM